MTEPSTKPRLGARMDPKADFFHPRLAAVGMGHLPLWQRPRKRGFNAWFWLFWALAAAEAAARLGHLS